MVSTLQTPLPTGSSTPSQVGRTDRQTADTTPTVSTTGASDEARNTCTSDLLLHVVVSQISYCQLTFKALNCLEMAVNEAARMS